jgi:hypothetical protein
MKSDTRKKGIAGFLALAPKTQEKIITLVRDHACRPGAPLEGCEVIAEVLEQLSELPQLKKESETLSWAAHSTAKRSDNTTGECRHCRQQPPKAGYPYCAACLDAGLAAYCGDFTELDARKKKEND